jgi:hypothetical protein
VRNYFESDTYSKTGDWLMGTARRNPEALLLLAAGCALLMRGGGGSSSSRTPARRQHSDDYAGNESQASYRSTTAKAPSSVGEGISRVREAATEYASDIKDRVSETAGSYTESMTRFAQDARDTVSVQSGRLRRQAQSTLQDGMNRVLRDQPLAVAVAGLAAGAAIASLFPSTEIESRSLGGAREALTEAASKAGENLMGAAGKAGERLKTAAAERGLTPDGLKNLAGEVAGTFANAVGGNDIGHDSATTVPKSPTSAANIGKNENTGSAGMARTGTDPSGRSNR